MRCFQQNLIRLSTDLHANPVRLFEPKWCRTLVLKSCLKRSTTSSLSISIDVSLPSSSSLKILLKPTSSERKRVSSKDLIFFSSNLFRTTLWFFVFFFKSSSSFYFFSLPLVMRRLTTLYLLLLFMVSIFLFLFKSSDICETWKYDIPKVQKCTDNLSFSVIFHIKNKKTIYQKYKSVLTICLFPWSSISKI